jgi:hypothetical protein
MLTTAHTTCKYSDNIGLIKKDTPKIRPKNYVFYIWDRQNRRESFQCGIPTPKTDLTFDLSSTENAGRTAFTG